MNNLSFGAVVAVISVLLAGCQTAPPTDVPVKPKATVATPAATTSTSPAVTCGHPVVEDPKVTAEAEFFPKGAPARRFTGDFALVRTLDGQVGLNPLFLSSTSRTDHPAFDGHPFDINVTKAVGNAVTITVPEDLAPHTGTPIDGIDSSGASVAKYLPRVVELPDSPMLGPISTMHVGEVRHALDMAVYADQDGCYYLDTRGSSWPGLIGMPGELAINRTPRGFNVVSATKKWQPFYPATITRAQDITAVPDREPTAPEPAALPLPALPDCLNQNSYPIVPLTGNLLPGTPACVMVGITYRNLKRTTVTLDVRTPNCGPHPTAATAILQGTGSKTLLVIEPCGDPAGSYSINYSRSVPKADIRIRAVTEQKD